MEEDFLGYKVFRAMKENEEFTPLTDVFFFDTLYIDSLGLKLSNPTARYTVIAYDNRYNPSPYCLEVVVKKPLKIPPAKPVFLSNRIEDEKIIFTWGKGSQKGLTQALYRRMGNDTTWISLHENDSIYVENEMKSNSEYCYIISLTNEFGISTTSDSLVIKTGNIQTSNAPKFKRFYTQYDNDKEAMALFWSDDMTNVEEYHIYRAANEEPITLWTTVPASQKAIYDKNVDLNTTYTYSILAVMKNGQFSEMKTIKVKH